MDKERVNKMARATGFVEVLADGSDYIDDRLHRFADMVESALAHKHDEARKKDQQDLTTLRQKVQNLASENIKLRAAIKNARECLDEVSSAN